MFRAALIPLAGLIVIGSRRQSMLRGLFLGSVARKALNLTGWNGSK